MMAFTDSAERSRTVQINIQAIKSSAPNTAAQSQPPPDRIECGGITTRPSPLSAFRIHQSSSMIVSRTTSSIVVMPS